MRQETVRPASIRVPPLRPLLHKARSALSQTPRIEQLARATILRPAEETWSPPAIMLPGQLERLRNFANRRERERLFRSAAGGLMRHEATIAYTIDGAVLSVGSIYAADARYAIRKLSACYPGPAPIHVSEGTLCTGPTGDRYFGHFLTEDLLQVMIAGEFGEAFRLPSRDWPHAPVYRSAFALDWREIAAARFDRLTFFSDFAQNTLRRARYAELRQRLRARLAAVDPGARVYLRRGATGNAISRVLGQVDGAPDKPATFARSPRNDDEVAEALQRLGFIIIDIGTTPPQALVETLLDASVIVSVEGSQLMHGVYTIAGDGSVCILMPPMRPMIQVKDRYDALGVRTAIVVGEDHGDAYTINIDELRRTLDLLARPASAQASRRDRRVAGC